MLDDESVCQFSVVKVDRYQHGPQQTVGQRPEETEKYNDALKQLTILRITPLVCAHNRAKWMVKKVKSR